MDVLPPPFFVNVFIFCVIYLLIFIDNSPKSLNCSYRNHLTAVLYAWYRRFYGCQALPNHFQAITQYGSTVYIGMAMGGSAL